MNNFRQFFHIQKRGYAACLGWLLVNVLSGCSEKSTTPEPPLSFALALNETQTFTIEEVSYAINREPAVTNYFIKETVVSIEEKVNEKTYIVERYKRINEGDQWRIERVYKLRQTPAELIEIGELPLLRLVFPVVKNSTFDINKYNNHGGVTATYAAINQPFENYKRTYSLYQANDSTLINLKRKFEVYAAVDGLIYKEDTELDYCQSSATCIGTGEVSFGKQVIWRRMR